MGQCVLCSLPAGFLRGEHKACRARFNDALTVVLERASEAMHQNVDLLALHHELIEIGARGHAKPLDIERSLIKVWRQQVDAALEDGLLSREEEDRLAIAKRDWALSDTELDRTGALTRVAQAGVLRDVLEGKVPDRMLFPPGLPFNLQKNERLLWVFKDVALLVEESQRHYVGSSAGVSFRLAKGLHYRSSTFKGYPVVTTSVNAIAEGLLGVSTKHLYFSGGGEHFRIAHNKIVALIPYRDGIGVQKDGVRARPQAFRGIDGWFAYNLLTNLGQIA